MASDGEYLAAAGAFANAAASVTAADMGKRSRKAYYKYLREAEDRADERALRNWNMQNEYNSPVAQMARYKEAGLNPNLIYGQDNTTGMPGSVEPVNPGYSPDDRGINGFQAAANAISAYQQIVSNQIANTNAARVGRLTESKIEAQDLANDVQRQTSEYNIQMLKAKSDSVKFKVLMDNHFGFLERKAKYEDILAGIESKKWKTAKDKQDIENLKEALKLLTAQIDLTKSQMDSINEETQFKRDTHDDRVLGFKLGNYYTGVQANNARIQGNIYQKDYENYDTRFESDLGNKYWNGSALSIPMVALKTFDKWLMKKFGKGGFAYR